MTPDELRAELDAGSPRPAYLLAGEEALLRDDTLAALRAAVLTGAADDFNLDLLDGDATPAGALTDAVRTLPVMAERRLVVLREPGRRRAGGQALLEALADAVADLGPEAPVVLVVTAASPDRRSRWVKAIARAGALVDCAPPRRSAELLAFIRAEAQRQGVKLGRGAAELLAERIGPQMLVLRQEIAKAALLVEPGEPVDRTRLAAGASDLAEEAIWDLTDAIGEGRTGDALLLLGRMLDRGAPEPVVLGALAAHVRKLVRLVHGGRVAGPPFVVRKLESQARRYRPAHARACLRAVGEVDQMLKGRGGAPPRMALERLVLLLAY